MSCYLCGKNSARITVERAGQPDETYTVCGICDEKGLYCFSCDVPLSDRDDKFELYMGWYAPPEVECERCAEARFDNYMETRVG